MIRKSALLFETGHCDDAGELIETALATIRESPSDERSIANSSREGWALLSTWRPENWQVFLKRCDELASLKCNAHTEIRNIADAIKDNGEKRKGTPFDLGVRRTSGWHFSSADPRTVAYKAILLSEVAGLPPIANHIYLAADILALAAEKLFEQEPGMAVRLVLRNPHSATNHTLNRVLSRTRVATLSERVVRDLAQICNGVIEYALSRITSGGPLVTFWVERLSVAMEVQSRLVLRLDPKKVEAVFDMALRCYENDHVAQHPKLIDPVRNIMSRSWESLPKDDRTNRVLDVLSAPIVGLDNFTVWLNSCPDPGEMLQREFTPPDRTSDNEDRWQKIIRLLVHGLSERDETRQRAAVRIFLSIALSDNLKTAETLHIAKALWSHNYTEDNGLPGKTTLLDWTFLLLPEPEPNLAKKRFHSKWLATSSPQDGVSVDDILWQVGTAISRLPAHGQSLTLSSEEQNHLVALVAKWAETPLPRHFFPQIEAQLREPIIHAISGLPSVLSNVKIPKSTAEKLYKKILDLDESKIPGRELVAGLATALPERFDELVSFMKIGLGSNSYRIAEDAAKGLYYWLRTTTSVNIHFRSPPQELIREIGVIIATRRKSALRQALEIAKWIYVEGNREQKMAIGQLTLDGLSFLAVELQYSCKNDQYDGSMAKAFWTALTIESEDDWDHDRDDDIDIVPLLRSRCVDLALAMKESDFGNNAAVARWIEIADIDTLPEIRYAKKTDFRY